MPFVSFEQGNSERIEVIRVSCYLERTFHVFTIYVVSEEHTAEEKCSLHAKIIINECHETLYEAIAGVSRLNQFERPTTVIHVGHNEIGKTCNRLEALLQDLAKISIQDKSYLVELKDRFRRFMEVVTFSPWCLTRVTEAILSSRDMIPLLASIVDKKTRKTVNFDLKRAERRKIYAKIPIVQEQGRHRRARDMRQIF